MGYTLWKVKMNIAYNQHFCQVNHLMGHGFHASANQRASDLEKPIRTSNLQSKRLQLGLFVT